MTITLNPQIVGRAENAHRPVLDRVLAGTGLTPTGWITLTLAGPPGSPDGTDLVARVTDAMKIDQATAQDAIGALVTAGLIDRDQPRTPRTAAGETLFRDVRAAIDQLLSGVYSDIPPDDLATAARVLLLVTARLDALTLEAA